MKLIRLAVIVGLAILQAGCIAAAVTGAVMMTKPPIQPPTAMEGENEYFKVRVTTDCDSFGCKSFNVLVENKSSTTLKIDWSKSQFISNNQAYGGFWYEGIVVRDRNMPRTPDVIFASGSYNKKVTPNILIDVALFPLVHWEIKAMPPGEIGIYLVMEAEEKEKTMKLVTKL